MIRGAAVSGGKVDGGQTTTVKTPAAAPTQQNGIVDGTVNGVVDGVMIHGVLVTTHRQQGMTIHGQQEATMPGKGRACLGKVARKRIFAMKWHERTAPIYVCIYIYMHLHVYINGIAQADQKTA